jgi:NAD(P)-dependent dehydrogenase (short-subunit alcohol dehydrogenase family)
MIDLTNKRILITGATGGIGKEIVASCLSLGAKVFAVGRNVLKLNEFSDNKNLVVLKCDLTKADDVEHLLNNLESLDGIVNCAGRIYPYPIKFIKEKQLREVYAINTEVLITLTAQLFQRKLINKKASLIFLSSISVNHPYMGGSLYVSSKAALEAFSKSVALEFAQDGIRSNCIAPALVQTEIYEQTMSAYSEEQWDKIITQYPLGIGKPKDVANLAVFLLSDLSSWITGVVIPMDGGLLLNSNR